MEAKELRIGNWVSYKGNLVKWSRSDFCDNVAIRLSSPIPLTEDWLKEFGFIEFNRTFWDRDDFYAVNMQQGYYRCEYLETDILYVHQLQNIYHAISGKELERKITIIKT